MTYHCKKIILLTLTVAHPFNILSVTYPQLKTCISKHFKGTIAASFLSGLAVPQKQSWHYAPNFMVAGTILNYSHSAGKIMELYHTKWHYPYAVLMNTTSYLFGALAQHTSSFLFGKFIESPITNLMHFLTKDAPLSIRKVLVTLWLIEMYMLKMSFMILAICFYVGLLLENDREFIAVCNSALCYEFSQPSLNNQTIKTVLNLGGNPHLIIKFINTSPVIQKRILTIAREKHDQVVENMLVERGAYDALEN